MKYLMTLILYFHFKFLDMSDSLITDLIKSVDIQMFICINMCPMLLNYVVLILGYSTQQSLACQLLYSSIWEGMLQLQSYAT